MIFPDTDSKLFVLVDSCIQFFPLFKDFNSPILQQHIKVMVPVKIRRKAEAKVKKRSSEPAVNRKRRKYEQTPINIDQKISII